MTHIREEDINTLDQIKESTVNGTLSASIAIERVSRLIEYELSKPENEVNYSLVRSCIELMEKLSPQDNSQYTTHFVENRDSIRRQLFDLQKQQKKSERTYTLVKAIAVLMVLGVLVGIGQFKYHWFLLLPSDDEQQMVITGHEISIELINRAIAEHNCYAQISTTKAEEIAEFLGFEPLYPPIDRSLWEQTEAIAFIYPDYIRISCTYQSTAQEQLHYRISYYNDYENAIYSFEQNLMGIERTISGTTVYQSDNYSQKALSWISKNAIISLYGTDVENSLLYQLVENMIGGKQ